MYLIMFYNILLIFLSGIDISVFVVVFFCIVLVKDLGKVGVNLFILVIVM